jgi:hypothetical protein
MTIRYDGVEDVLEQFVGLFITSNQPAGLDVGMTLVVNTSLNALGEADAWSLVIYWLRSFCALAEA